MSDNDNIDNVEYEIHEHSGGIALYGDRDREPLQHEFAGQLIHRTAPKHPLVHIIGWSSDDTVEINHKGSVELTNSPEAPLNIHMTHEFTNDLHQTHEVTLAPVDHSLSVNTQLHEPIHHALQMRTPLQLRFCNMFLVKSDYNIELRIGDRSLINIRLRGATTVEPQPCDDEC